MAEKILKTKLPTEPIYHYGEPGFGRKLEALRQGLIEIQDHINGSGSTDKPAQEPEQETVAPTSETPAAEEKPLTAAQKRAAAKKAAEEAKDESAE